MKSLLSYFILLARKWAWLVLLGVIVCSSATLLVSKRMHPVYQASTTLIISLGTSQSAFDNLNASIGAIPTYAQLVTSNEVLGPVVAQHSGLTIDQLKAATTVKQQSNTQILEVDVQSSNPGVATQLVNEIGESFAQFANTRLLGTVEILPAQLPTSPVSLQTKQATLIGALVGLGLALALIVAFEWIDDRVRNPEEVQEHLGGNVLSVLPFLTRAQRSSNPMEIPAFAEGCRILCARLQAVRKMRSFKMLMITSPTGNEGKSTIASHLATLLAVTGNRVLLVDANQSALLAEGQYTQAGQHPDQETWTELEEKLYGDPSNVPNLRTLNIGALSASYAGVLPFPWNNRFFEYFRKATFDYVIFDALSLLPNAASQVLASSVQTILVVVDASQTPRKVLSSVKGLLSNMYTRVPMVVINKSNWPELTRHRQRVMDLSYHLAGGTELQKIDTPSPVPQNGMVDPERPVVHRPSQRDNDGQS
jgi:polysaccharide biosynthesis transport protein